MTRFAVFKWLAFEELASAVVRLAKALYIRVTDVAGTAGTSAAGAPSRVVNLYWVELRRPEM